MGGLILVSVLNPVVPNGSKRSAKRRPAKRIGAAALEDLPITEPSLTQIPIQIVRGQSRPESPDPIDV